MNNMGKVEKEVICPIKIISFDSNVSTLAEENNTMQLDVIKQLIKYTNTTDNVDVTFETVPISFDNTSFTNRSTASEQNIKSNKMKGSAFDSKYIKFETVPILFDNSSSTNRSTASEQNTGINEEMKEADSNNFDGLYSDLEYLDEFEPVVQTFIEKPASVSHLKNNTTMTNTFFKTNPDQSDTNFTDETSNDDDSTTEHLEQRLSPNDVAQLSYIDTVIKDLSEKYRKQRLLDGSVFKTKCDLFLYKVREADQAKVFPRQETTYLFKKINQTRTIARWTRRDYDHLGNVGEEVGNTEVLKRVEWDYCRKVLDKRKDEVVQLPSSDNGKRLATQYTVILNADTEAADGCLTVFDTRNNSLFHLKIEEAIENTNAVNITNLSSKDDGYLYDSDGKRRKYIPKREQSSYIVKMKMTNKCYLCTKCNELFADKKGYTRHMKIHFVTAKENAYSENRSGKSSDLKKSEDRRSESHFKPHSSSLHKKISRSGKPFMCDECGRSVKRLDAFRNHLMSHAGVKRYSCHICGRRFLQKITLKLHLLVHSGKKPYRCNICPKSYKKNVTLKRHQHREHDIIHPRRNRRKSGTEGNENEDMEELARKEETQIKTEESANCTDDSK